MDRKHSTVFFLLFILLLCSSCYTVQYPKPCPGVSEIETNPETDMEMVLID